MQKLRTMLTDKLSGIILGLMVIQPALDVLSYFADGRGLTSLTTLLRFGLLALVALLGFILTDKKPLYLVIGGVIALFWAAHMLNCFRIGYASPVEDTANLLRLMSFPLYTLVFITMLKGRPHLRGSFYLGVFIAFLEIIIFTALPWLMGQPVYTYRRLEIGVMGWFLTPSAQSAIIVISAPLAVFAAYRSGRYPVYLLGVLLPVALMFITGTKLNFYSIFIICCAYIFLFALQLGKKSLRYVLPLCVLLVAAAALKGYSPMAARNSSTANSNSIQNSLIANSMSDASSDRAALRAAQDDDSGSSSERQLEKARRVVLPIYSDTSVYGYFTQDLNSRFGMYNVMDALEYTDSPEALANARNVKLNYAHLMWQEKDTLTHLLGFEYKDFVLGDSIYDPENDFPGVFYNMGYLGFALYILIFVLLFYVVLRAFAGAVSRSLSLERERASGPRARLWLRGFWGGLKDFMTLETGAAGICFLLSIGAAQISGNVLRRPNVAIYFAVASACLYSITVSLPRPRRNGKKEV